MLRGVHCCSEEEHAPVCRVEPAAVILTLAYPPKEDLRAPGARSESWAQYERRPIHTSERQDIRRPDPELGHISSALCWINVHVHTYIHRKTTWV
jgi:hypothetical protein